MNTVTHLSSKGQVIIPKKVREQHSWHSGAKFLIINFEDGIVLKPVKPKQQVNITDLIGIANYKGKRKSLAAMEAGIAKGAKAHA